MTRDQHRFSEEVLALPPGNWVPDQWGVLKYVETQPNDLIPHGTPAGYVKHHYYDIPVCEPCQAAHNANRKNQPAECGSRSGYTKHRRKNEDPCIDCKQAQREYDHNRRQSQKEAA